MQKIIFRKCSCGFFFHEEEEVYERVVPLHRHCMEKQAVVLSRKPTNHQQLNAIAFETEEQIGYIYACPNCGAWLYAEGGKK